MSIKEKMKKLNRWRNIWYAQFAAGKIENRKDSLQNNKILIIKLDAIGDFIIWLDSAKEFQGLYPDQNLTLMCNEICMPIAKNTGYFDEIITLDIKKFETDRGYKKRKINEFHSLHFELLIQTAYSRTVHMDLLAASISAGRKIGFVADETRTNLSRYIIAQKNRARLDGIYDQLIFTQKGTLMEIQRNGELIRGLGKKDFSTAKPVLPIQEVRTEIIPTGNYCIIFPGNSTPKKRWPIQNFSQIADYVYTKTGWSIYVCGSSSEQILFEEMKQLVSQDTVVYDYCGKTSLVELAEVTRGAKMVISNDTSEIHFAAAVNTPSICILGDWDYGRFLPYDYDKKEDTNELMLCCDADMECKHCAAGRITKECKRCLAETGRYLCIEKVSITKVIKAVDEIIMQKGAIKC